jgi:Kyakuja-Dileera-Zisupton transposase
MDNTGGSRLLQRWSSENPCSHMSSNLLFFHAKNLPVQQPHEASSDHQSPSECLSTSIISDSVPNNTLASINTTKDTSAEPDLDDPEKIAWLNVAKHDKLAKCLNMCIDCWHNTDPEARKKMYMLFAIVGIFLAMYWRCVTWSEVASCTLLFSLYYSPILNLAILRMEYPIVIIDHLLELYGSDIGLAYDIMCAFIKTVTRSSLGAKVVGLWLHGVVPTLHRHAHNCGCQINWLPLHVEGAGLEDFEECKWTFSKSNKLASITQLVTPFQHQQQIDEHFKFHDDDKYASSGKSWSNLP